MCKIIRQHDEIMALIPPSSLFTTWTTTVETVHFVCVDLLSEEEPWTKSTKFVLMPVWTGRCGLSACSCSPLSCPHLVVQVRFMDLCFQRVTLQMLTQSRCKSAYLSTFNAFAKVSVLFCIEGLTIKAGCSARGDYLFTFWGNKLKICASVI